MKQMDANVTILGTVKPVMGNCFDERLTSDEKPLLP